MNESNKSVSLPVLGVPIAQVAYEDVLRQLDAWLTESPACPHSVIAANVHVVTEAALHAEYRAAVLDAALVLPDGMPLVWATRLLGGRLADRCYGPTLMERTLDHFQGKKVRHFFYGTTESTLERLKEAVARRWPGAVITGACAPGFGSLNDAAERDNIGRMNAAAPDIVWVAMGCPKQELWLQRYRQEVRASAVLAVGAAFDFISGTVRQAPPWLQHAGLEWAFRLSREPSRLWKRYLFRNPYFLFQFLLQLLHLRWQPEDGTQPLRPT